MGAEFTLGVVATVVIGVIGGLLSRSISQIDDKLEAFGEMLAAHSVRLALLEERIRRPDA